MNASAGASVGAALVGAAGDAGGGGTQATRMTRAIRSPAKRQNRFLESIICLFIVLEIWPRGLVGNDGAATTSMRPGFPDGRMPALPGGEDHRDLPSGHSLDLLDGRIQIGL